ncbi:MAG: glycerol kinase GlpK [Gammaproteobacteria bacterium]|nr:glycerol kinase GlpK [Gammaproteobacteria bacterium]
MTTFLLSIDQGTTSSRAIIFNHQGQLVAQHQIELAQQYPHDGWVEQSPLGIWSNTLICCKQVLLTAQLSAKDIAAVGITNQRETTLIWDKKTGECVYPAIVWQDSRTAEYCKKLREEAINTTIQSKTGLMLDPYFSASKIAWILDNVPNARLRAERGELVFGTVDTFLLWKLTKGKMHATDATNASRTLLYNIHTQCWDSELLKAFNIPDTLLPVVLDSADQYGVISSDILGFEIPITAMIGDQQAATVGQACFSPGMIKATYGTGCFMLLNTGDQCLVSKNKLISTIAYRLKGKVTYGLEGSIFSAGVTLKWLRDSLNLIANVADSHVMAGSIDDAAGVYFVPAFTGLGAPYWDSEARGALLGLTRNTRVEHIVRAGLEAVCYQTRDLLTCMKLDGIEDITTLRVDGGMVVNDWLLQFLSNILGVVVQRPACIETSALGAAFLAGLQRGIYQSLEEISHLWQANAKFSPKFTPEQSENLYLGWKNAVEKIIIRR